MRELFNPIDTYYKSVVGGVALETPLTFRVLIPLSCTPEGVHFCVINEGNRQYNIAMDFVGEVDGYAIFEADYNFFARGLYWFYFSFWNGFRTEYISKGGFGLGEVSPTVVAWQVTVVADGTSLTDNLSSLGGNYSTSLDWFHGGVMYQIFPDRFCSCGDTYLREGGVRRSWGDKPFYLPIDGKILNNDFFGGNFEGIISKLDYLKGLGVTILYLNPIFEGESNHKYDTCDFERIDMCFGGEEKFKKFLDEAHANGMHVILDGVFNHVGENSRYFNKGAKYNCVGAYQSKESEFFSWFTFLNHPDEYLCWWGIELLPAIRGDEQAYVDYITGEGGVAEKYIKMGVDGYRLDVVDELSSDFLSRLTDRVRKTNKNAMVLGEVWEDASNKIAYDKRRKYFTDNQLDSVMNYPWKNAIIGFVKHGNAKWLYYEIIEIINNYPKRNLDLLMNILSTHDTERILTCLSGKERGNLSREDIADWTMTDEQYKAGFEKVKMASVLQFTLPGVPSLYYGDEAGMQGYGDPFNRCCFPWGNEDKNFQKWYKKLCQIRKLDVFKDGDLEIAPFKEGVIAYERKKGDECIKVVVNNSGKDVKIKDIWSDFESGTNLLTGRGSRVVKSHSTFVGRA